METRCSLASDNASDCRLAKMHKRLPVTLAKGGSAWVCQHISRSSPVCMDSRNKQTLTSTFTLGCSGVVKSSSPLCYLLGSAERSGGGSSLACACASFTAFWTLSSILFQRHLKRTRRSIHRHRFNVWREVNCTFDTNVPSTPIVTHFRC